MEVARLTRFLESKILFFSTPKMEKALKNELWTCHKYMKISMTELLRMPVADRKTFIVIHNRLVEKEKKEMDAKMNSK